MASLTPTSPANGLLPIIAGDTTLTEHPDQEIWAILPYKGQTQALSQALQKAHGTAFPAPGASQDPCHWNGLDQALMIGQSPDPSLSAHAALIDQTGGWAHLNLTGGAAADVLARLVPVDLAHGAAATRTLIGHMPALILRREVHSFDLLVYRSMAQTCVTELGHAMAGVAARASLQ